MYKDREKYLLAQLRYNEAHREQRRELSRKWRLNNKDKKAEYNRKYTMPYLRRIDIYAKEMYRMIIKRLKTNPYYNTRTINFDREQFLYFVFNKTPYNEMHKKWEENNYSFKLSPTVDRINNLGNYTLDNIQILTRSDNSKKSNK